MNKHSQKTPTSTTAPAITELPLAELEAAVGGIDLRKATLAEAGADELIVVKTAYGAGYEMGTSMN